MSKPSAKEFIERENVANHPTLSSWMESYHAAAMAEVRAAVDGLVADSMKKLQKAGKDSIESTVFATRAVALGDV